MEEWYSNPTVIGIAAGVLTSVSMLPQLFKMIREKNSENISIGMLILLLVGLCGWVYYGTLRKDLPVIITNALAVAINIGNLFFGIKYKGRKK